MTNKNYNGYGSYENSNLAYDLSAFQVERRVREPQQEPDRQRRLRLADDPQPKTAEALRAEEMQGLKRAISAVLVAVLCLGMFGMMIGSFVKKNELNHQLISNQKLLAQQESEYARLSVLLNSMASAEKVEEYATNELGMIKLKNGQTTYIAVADDSEADSAVDNDIQNTPQ